MNVIKLEKIKVNCDVPEVPYSQSSVCFKADVHFDERTSSKRLLSSCWYFILNGQIMVSTGTYLDFCGLVSPRN